jgi:histone H3/H4
MTSHYPKVFQPNPRSMRFQSNEQRNMDDWVFEKDPKLTQLPAATVQKIINEVLVSKAGGDSSAAMAFAKETRDLLIECCVEFITMISTEANEIAEKDAKKTIACEHITKSLEELGFGEYVPELERVAGDFKHSMAVRVCSFFL